MTHSPPTTNPSGGAGARRVDTQPALDNQLMERVVDPANVQRAWKQVRANHGAPGSDGLTVEQTEAWLQVHWPTVRQSLLEGTYQPQPLRRKAIPSSPRTPPTRQREKASMASRRADMAPRAAHRSFDFPVGHDG